jgi:hypothetical protein
MNAFYIALALLVVAGGAYWLGYRTRRQHERRDTAQMLASANDSNLLQVHRAQAYREIDERLSHYSVGREGRLQEGGGQW